MDYSKNFCINLNYWLQARGLTQKDVMVDLGIPSSTMSNWCTGARVPKMSKVKMLADYLKIDVADLLEDRFTKGVTKDISREAQVVAAMFIELDDHGKSIVLMVLNSELERCKGARS